MDKTGVAGAVTRSKTKFVQNINDNCNTEMDEPNLMEEAFFLKKKSL